MNGQRSRPKDINNKISFIFVLRPENIVSWCGIGTSFNELMKSKIKK